MQRLTEKELYPANLQQIELGLKVLHRRKRNLTVLAVVIATLGFASLITIFFQQEFVFNLFGVAQQVNQLHIPFTVDSQLQDYIHQPDYLMNAFSWLGWLILKLIVSFIGAFILVGILKKFQFFLLRFQSFILKFVAWLVCFIVLWSGLAFVQYHLKDDENKELRSFVKYDQYIQQSDMYQYLQRQNTPEVIQNYLLAQTALLHKPADKVVATVYSEKLIKAEQTDPHFLEYGFKPEQLWTIQHEVFDQAISPLAKSVEPQIIRANFWSNLVEKFLSIISAISLLLSLVIYLVAHRIAKRLQRIGDRFH